MMRQSPRRVERDEHFHVVHKLLPGDSPYVRAKHLQLIDKDPEMAIVLFWEALNVGDRVDSALKDMAVVMKQQDRAEEAIEAIKAYRDRCSRQAQESLDNVLIDLYKADNARRMCKKLVLTVDANSYAFLQGVAKISNMLAMSDKYFSPCFNFKMFSFLCMNLNKIKNVDDPDLHSGKIRSVFFSGSGKVAKARQLTWKQHISAPETQHLSRLHSWLSHPRNQL